MSLNRYSPNDYSRNERKESSWWNLRHPSDYGIRKTAAPSRRLILIDIIFLLIIGGVIVPVIINRNNTWKTGAYKISIDKKTDGDSQIIFLNITGLPEKNLQNTNSAEVPETDNNPVGWEIYSEQGKLLHKESDLPPSPGETRVFMFTAKSGSKLECRAYAAGKEHVFTIN
jgi:hypothetical protein